MNHLPQKKTLKPRSDNLKWFDAGLLKVYMPALAILVIIRLQTSIPIANLTRDPLAIVESPFYFGLVSNLSILLWCSCAAICFLVALAIPQSKISKKFRLFLLFSGLITSLLLLDDLFLLHEEAFPNYVHIPEKIVFLVYAILLFLYILKFRKVILKTKFFTLILAFVFFGFSMLLDKGITTIIPQIWLQDGGSYLLEDGAKLLGILSWLVYFVQICVSCLKKAIETKPIDVEQDNNALD